MKRACLLIGVMALLSLAHAAKPWDGAYARFEGDFLIYSGSLSESAAPTAADRKASFMLRGEAAQDLFGSIGPDLKDACGSSSGMRVRRKGDLDCTFDKDDRTSPYTCYFGMNLRTGKSMQGSIC